MKRAPLSAVNFCRCVARHCLGSATGMLVGGAMMNFVFIQMESLMMLSLFLCVLDFLATELLA